MESLGRPLIAIGLVLVVLGVLLSVYPSLPLLGKLPGDLRIERPGMRIHLPIASCIVVSVVLSGALWLLSRLR